MENYSENTRIGELSELDLLQGSSIPLEWIEMTLNTPEYVHDTNGPPSGIAADSVTKQHQNGELNSTNTKDASAFKGKVKRTKENRNLCKSAITKMRRLSANERERRRMRGMNEAFDRLRAAIPSPSSKQLSKYDTLLMTQNYIRALQDMLNE